MFPCKSLCLLLRGIPLYIGAVVLGAAYVSSWMVAGIAILAGLFMHVYYNHMRTFAICIPWSDL